MERLQVRYCYNLTDLNEFLKTVNVGSRTKYPYLHSIQYLPKVYGNGVETKEADENGVTATADVGCDIAAVVQYFVEVEVEE